MTHLPFAERCVRLLGDDPTERLKSLLDAFLLAVLPKDP